MTQNKFAVTGGIGSGKTLFCNILKSMGYEVLSCDGIYAEMLQEAEYLSLLQARFPDCFAKGTLDKKRLAERVFSSRKDREQLEALAHPMIMHRLLERMEGKERVFAEVPLLFEGGYEGLFDHVIVLVRNKQERIESVMRRSGLTEQEVIERMESQFAPALLSGKKCLIVENNGSEADLMQKAKEIVKNLG